MTDARQQRDFEPDVDDGLVRRAKTDRAAFGLLFDRYYPHVSRYSFRRLNDRAMAEEVTAEVFLQVASHLSTFAGETETDFRRWLFRIATNAVVTHLRQTHRRAELLQSAARQGRLLRSTDETPLNTELDPLDWPTLHAALAELDERDQTIITLRFFADCTHEEIAGVVGASAGAVRTALSRALARLREILGELGESD
jgi:RNA polymerase sigma-70 factor (ECF subfamily)